MSRTDVATFLGHTDSFFIDGEWVSPSTSSTIGVVDSTTEETFYSVPEAKEADVERAVSAARVAFDTGPWSRLTPQERAPYLRAMAAGIRNRADDIGQLWTRQAGILRSISGFGAMAASQQFDFYADLADTYPFQEQLPLLDGSATRVVREPVGVVAAIVAWNGPITLLAWKVAPALLAGCTVVAKSSPEAPGEAYVLAEVAAEAGLPPGVLNVVTADREVSEHLVRDPRVDKVSFTGSTQAGRRIASILGERIGRFTLELGGKSAAIVLDDADIGLTALRLAGAECMNTGQVCNSLTRVIVARKRHDECAEALAGVFSQVAVGDPFEEATQMGPLAMSRQRDRVEQFIAIGVREGAQLVTGGGRPEHLDRGYFIQPTVFGGVDNSSTIAQEEIFGPVLSVIPADSEAEAIAMANDTIYGLNASVFTEDSDRALSIARQLRSGTVSQNGARDGRASMGGFKQSGIGREGGVEGLLPYLEFKAVTLENLPSESA